MEILLDQLSTLSHANRMRVFRLLVRRYPDALPAGEIAQVLDYKASTTSVYLSALTKAGLIEQHRFGTTLKYQLNLQTARTLVADLFRDCCGGRPDLCPPDFYLQTLGDTVMEKTRFNVLFVCTGNSARSLFAEAILRHEAGDRFNAYSAGTTPASAPNPRAIEMMQSKGIDTAALQSKHMSEFQSETAPSMDFVFTVCDLAANEECPPWPGQPISAHWGLPDPVKATGTDAEKRLAFQQTYGAMRNRIMAFAALPIDTLDRASLQTKLDDLGKDLETT